MTNCTTMLPMAMMAFCKAMGKPSFSKVRLKSREGFKSPGSTWRMVIFRTLKKQYTAEATWETTVAMAAPAMPQWKPTTKSKSRATFIRAATTMAYRGVLASPRARKMAARKL